MLIETPGLPMRNGNNFPWGAVIVLTLAAFSIGFIAYKTIEVEPKTLSDEGHDRIA